MTSQYTDSSTDIPIFYPYGYVANQIGPSWTARDPGLPRRQRPPAPPPSPQQTINSWYVLVQFTPEWGEQERDDLRHAYDALHDNQNVIISQSPDDLERRRGVLITVSTGLTDATEIKNSALDVMGSAMALEAPARNQVRRWPLGTQSDDLWMLP